jgi:TonB-linked SusC/RagA family outer membrane protein
MTPFYYGLTTVNGELGVQHTLTQLTEGTETLNDPESWSTAYSNFYFEVAAQYNRTFGKHDVGALLVGQMKESLNTISGNNAFATLPSRNLGLSGRITYGYDNRYFIEGNFGYNGSEKFAIRHRFGFFPSVGGAWILSNEPFFKGGIKKVFPSIKFKASYGLVGNDEISNPDDRFFYLSSVSTNNSGLGHTFGYDFNNTYNGYSVGRYSNEEIGWEIAEKANFGIEANILDVFNIQAEYFTEQRSAIYQTRESTPLTLGTTAPIKGNIGSAKAHGIDASIDANWSLGSDFWLTGRANFTYSTSEYIDGGDLRYPEAYRNRPGHSINQQWGYVAERLFIDKQDILNSPSQFGLYVSPGNKVSAEDKVMPGDIKYVDINKDGVINEKDQVAIGFPSVPEIIYGFGVSMGWKFIDFSFFFQGSARSSFFIDPTSIEPFTSYRNAMTIVADNYWSETNPDPYAFWPRLSTTQIENNMKNSTWWLRDGSFLRLKQVEIGFSLPRKTLSKLGMTQARIFFSGNNLFCFSDFELWDPEMGGYGIGYPIQRVYNVGINVSF